MDKILVSSLTKALSDVYVFSVKLQCYHWNVEGKDFVQYHELFGSMYDDVHGSIDTIAELMRTLDVYAPCTLKGFLSESQLKEVNVIQDAYSMAESALSDNNLVTSSLLKAYKDAEDLGECGISNYLQDRIQAHEKHKWFLKSINKGK